MVHVSSSSGLYKIGITIPALQTVLREAKSGLRRFVSVDSSVERFGGVLKALGGGAGGRKMPCLGPRGR